jgi:uncharacterized SAM-binding protein YcdF (DUF218 family)
MTLLITALALTLGYLVVLFGVLVGYSLSTARRREAADGTNVVLVLGAPVRYGQVMPLLARRLDTALQLYNEAKRNTVIVVSGGRPTSSYGTEAKAMAHYLIERGVPADRVLLEDQSTTTRENIRFSKELVFSHAKAGPVTGGGSGGKPVIVTSDFHVLRTANICRRNRLRATVVGAASSARGIRRSILREYALLLGDLWRLHIVAAVLITAVVFAVAR